MSSLETKELKKAKALENLKRGREMRKEKLKEQKSSIEIKEIEDIEINKPNSLPVDNDKIKKEVIDNTVTPKRQYRKRSATMNDSSEKIVERIVYCQPQLDLQFF